MFELSVACKYLIPRWRQLSVSIISLISILVIGLVVWLIVVFFSVKDGLENSWVDKIIALTAPIRVTPTEKYYDSYYYLADTISQHSNYTAKSIGEKLYAELSDPYDATIDEEIPLHWAKPDKDDAGNTKNLVKLVAALASRLTAAKNIKITDYETTIANIRLRLIRPSLGPTKQSQQFIDHAVYIGSYDNDVPVIAKTLQPFTSNDFFNLLQMQAISADNIQEDSPSTLNKLPPEIYHKRLHDFFSSVAITALKTPPQGWRIPSQLLPSDASFIVKALIKDGDIARIVLPMDKSGLRITQQNDGEESISGTLTLSSTNRILNFPEHPPQELPNWIPIFLEGDLLLAASLQEASIDQAAKAGDLRFRLNTTIQGVPLNGDVNLSKLEIGEASALPKTTDLFVTTEPATKNIHLPHNDAEGYGILLPRSFKEAGSLVGDQGYIAYQSPTPSAIQEQRVPIFVAGFYDPGIIPIGGKYLLASKDLIGQIRSSYDSSEVLASNGFNVRFDNYKDAAKIKAELLQAFEREGIAPYWKIQTYQEYDYTKDLLQQLNSEKNVFSVISLVIIIVACSNIISMLIILVNDKKLEIGILRSMGASSGSIAAIFGFCGIVMGTVGSVIGILASILTLHYLNELVALLGRLQGYDLFNPVFYGSTLPSEMSMEALIFVMITTAFISLLAGIVPAVKASMLRPADILKSE